MLNGIDRKYFQVVKIVIYQMLIWIRNRCLFLKIDVSPFVVEFGQRWDKVKYVVDTTNHISSRGQGGAYSKNRTFFVQNTHLVFISTRRYMVFETTA